MADALLGDQEMSFNGLIGTKLRASYFRPCVNWPV